MDFQPFEHRAKELLIQAGSTAPVLQTPPNPEWGSIGSPVFYLAKDWKRSPTEIAKEVAQKIQTYLHPQDPIIKVEAHAGYVNFVLDPQREAEVRANTILSAIHEG